MVLHPHRPGGSAVRQTRLQEPDRERSRPRVGREEDEQAP